jgi:hypothetical protein
MSAQERKTMAETRFWRGKWDGFPGTARSRQTNQISQHKGFPNHGASEHNRLWSEPTIAEQHSSTGSASRP